MRADLQAARPNRAKAFQNEAPRPSDAWLSAIGGPATRAPRGRDALMELATRPYKAQDDRPRHVASRGAFRAHGPSISLAHLYATIGRDSVVTDRCLSLHLTRGSDARHTSMRLFQEDQGHSRLPLAVQRAGS